MQSVITPQQLTPVVGIAAPEHKPASSSTIRRSSSVSSADSTATKPFLPLQEVPQEAVAVVEVAATTAADTNAANDAQKLPQTFLQLSPQSNPASAHDHLLDKRVADGAAVSESSFPALSLN